MDKVRRTIDTLKKYFHQGWIIQCGLSGKDSAVTSHCAVEALKEAKEEDENCPGILCLVTSNTTLDNFEVHSFIMDLHRAADEYAQEYDLPIFTQEIKPVLFSTPWVEHIGRGKLLRTAKTSVNGRDCVHQWKIIPNMKFRKELIEKYQTEKILNISGVRSDESRVRANNIDKRGETIDVIAKTDMGFTLAPIKDWSLNDVWTLIGKIENDCVESYIDLHARRLRTIYASANSGTCDIFAGNHSKATAKCGARFGCVTCSMNTGEDKSLSSQIETDEKTYGYMRPFIKLKKFLNDTLYDMERSRSLLGREVKAGSWLKVGYNQYSLEYRKELLRYVLTIDANERERAAALGIEPKFEMITPEVIVAIQFHFSREGGEILPGEALKIYHDVHTYGKRYEIPDTSDVAYSGQKLHFATLNFIGGNQRMEYRYVNLEELATQFESSFLGFKADSAEKAVLGYHHAIIDGKYEMVTPYSETKAQTINTDLVEHFLFDYYFDLEAEGFFSGENGYDDLCPSVMLKMLLAENIVTIRKGGLNRLHLDLVRAQMYNAINKAKDAGCSSVVEYIILARSITEAEYNEQIEAANDTQEDDFQLALGF